MIAEAWVGCVLLGAMCVAAAVRLRRLERDAARMRGKLYDLAIENVGLRVALRGKRPALPRRQSITLKQPERWPAVDVVNMKRRTMMTLWLN